MFVYVLDKQIVMLRSFHERLVGLIGRTSVSPEKAYVLAPCQQVHMFFMRIPITAIYLDQYQRVLWSGVLVPWTVGPYIREAEYVVESSDLALAGEVKPGMVVQF